MLSEAMCDRLCAIGVFPTDDPRSRTNSDLRVIFGIRSESEEPTTDEFHVLEIRVPLYLGTLHRSPAKRGQFWAKDANTITLWKKPPTSERLAGWKYQRLESRWARDEDRLSLFDSNGWDSLQALWINCIALPIQPTRRAQ